MLRQVHQSNSPSSELLPPFPELPPEINEYILLMLSIHDLAIVARTSKAFKVFAAGLRTWYSTFIERAPIDLLAVSS